MKKIITSAVALVAGALLLSGCTSAEGTYSLDTSKLSSYDSVEDLAAAFTEAGGNCETFTDMPTIPGNTSAMCEDGSQLLIMSQKNVDELRSSVNNGTSLQGVEVINGQNWGVITLDPSKHDDLAKALGGEVIRERR